MQDCAVGAVFGEHITLRETSALFVFARRVDGEVKNVVTPASALAFGAGIVLALALFRRLRSIF